jgi:murein DD-endopeptidase MepM/ murein hydrolase activator NlpD
MHKATKLLFIPSGEKPVREFSISKRGFYTGIIVLPLLSLLGFYLVFSGILQKDEGISNHRRQMARENFKLTNNILELKKSYRHLKSQIKNLSTEKEKILAMSEIKIKGTTIPPARDAANQPEKTFSGDKSNGDNIDILLARVCGLTHRLDSLYKIMIRKTAEVRNMPTTVPVSGDNFIIRGFGRGIDPFSDRKTFHYGVDFAGKLGEPVFAAGDGIVKSVGKDAFFGKMISIKHGQSTETFYAHLQSINVQEGQKITRGQIIAAIGNTGLTTGPHLHYEIMTRGKKRDPLLYYLPDLSTRHPPDL